MDPNDVKYEGWEWEQPLTISEISVLRLQPGDTVVVHTERILSTEAKANIRLCLEGAFPGHKALVVDSGLRLGVLREGQQEPEYMEPGEDIPIVSEDLVEAVARGDLAGMLPGDRVVAYCDQWFIRAEWEPAIKREMKQMFLGHQCEVVFGDNRNGGIRLGLRRDGVYLNLIKFPKNQQPARSEVDQPIIVEGPDNGKPG